MIGWCLLVLDTIVAKKGFKFLADETRPIICDDHITFLSL